MAPAVEQSSRLLALPAEIRNYIYTFAVVEDSPIEYYEVRKSSFLGGPAILRVCRQTRTEAMPNFYGANTFQPGFFRNTEDFLQDLSPYKLAFLRSVRASDVEISPQDQFLGPKYALDWARSRVSKILKYY